MIESINNTKSEQIKKYLLDQILNQKKYLPGDRLVETKIANEFDISQSPVREALNDLKAMGFIESKPYKGSWVKEINIKEMIDMYKVRAELESLAVKEAIPIITDNNIKTIKEMINKMNIASENNDLVKQLDIDSRFHELIIQTSNNKVLIKIWQNLGIKYWIAWGLFYLENYEGFNLKKQVIRHQKIFNSIQEKDISSASKVVRDHYLENIKLLKNQDTYI